MLPFEGLSMGRRDLFFLNAERPPGEAASLFHGLSGQGCRGMG